MLWNLKTALAARKMRQVDLAFAVRQTPSVISEIIIGRRRPNAELRARIAQVLRADVQWLFTEGFPLAHDRLWAQPGQAGTQIGGGPAECSAGAQSGGGA